MQLIVSCPKPVIAEVGGIATAAGCQLVASCDLAISSDTAQFATPGVNIGLFCSTPMVALSRNVSKKEAMKMLLTGDMIDAVEAKRISLINDYVSEDKLEESVNNLANKNLDGHFVLTLLQKLIKDATSSLARVWNNITTVSTKVVVLSFDNSLPYL